MPLVYTEEHEIFRKSLKKFFENIDDDALNTLTGLNEDNKSAGYIPEEIPTATIKPNKINSIFKSLNRLISISFSKKELDALSIKLLNEGKINDTINNAAKNAAIDIITDSLKNCAISWFRRAPATFLTPISFARFEDHAVERLI